MRPFRMRTIVEENIVVEKVEGAREKYPRIDDIYNSLQWRLSRSAEDGLPISGKDEEHSIAYIFKTMDVRHEPSILVLYQFDDDEVHFLDVRIG